MNKLNVANKCTICVQIGIWMVWYTYLIERMNFLLTSFQRFNFTIQIVCNRRWICCCIAGRRHLKPCHIQWIRTLELFSYWKTNRICRLLSMALRELVVLYVVRNKDKEDRDAAGFVRNCVPIFITTNQYWSYFN